MFLRFQSFTRKHGRISKGALERSMSTDVREKSLSNLPFTSNTNDILTLDPNKFAERKQQCLHIENLQSFQPRVLFNESSPASLRLYYDHTRTTHPPDLKAFLYYSISPEKPRIAGELRLRVVSSDGPASFERGSDLLLTNGQPWFSPLYSLQKYSLPLYKKLREDQLIPDDLDAALSTLPSKIIQYRRSQILYTLNDTFIIDFNTLDSVPFVITEQGVVRLRFKAAFADERLIWKGIRPYTGSALARFERSTLPVHKGTKTVVLRLLKMITPVKCVFPLYDDYMCLPKEGELYRKTKRYVSDSDVWSVNIDSSKLQRIVLRGLRLLWDT